MKKYSKTFLKKKYVNEFECEIYFFYVYRGDEKIYLRKNEEERILEKCNLFLSFDRQSFHFQVREL